ncbi:MAG TPA: hypothetical protein VMM79_17815 [Longimicrobiales bacterium]|nr:hypothetical protein [Longimicrobiales bacterium]
MSNSVIALTLASAMSLVVACGDPVGPDPETVTITLEVTGGFAGVDFVIEVDGSEGVARGVRCAAGCAFDDGHTLMGLSDFQIADLAVSLENAGMFRYESRDFGVQCCDQFEYRLTYQRARRDGDLTGSSGSVPESIARVIARLHALAELRLPAIVDFATSPAEWPAAPVAIDSLSIDGSELVAHVRYGGGCQHHSIDLVIWAGFLESEPVQAAALLAHDGRNDMCDALVSDTRRFDLAPLRLEWQLAYGVGPGSIVLNVSGPGSSPTVAAEYRF